MATQKTSQLLNGVIEGFYGQPWSQAERIELLGWIANWGLNTYLYAPKDDLHQRAAWREPYSAVEKEQLGTLIAECQKQNVRFIYAISPGLDIRYRDETELELLQSRFYQMRALGCRDFAVLFDDIPQCMDPEDAERFSSLASAQAHVANALFQSPAVSEGRFLFCPTAYCGRMAKNKIGGENYLQEIGRKLLPEIDILWTGPEIISRELTVAHITEMQTILRRKPVVWDNLHANDYDGRRFFCGPYAGRATELRHETKGFLSNPNNEFPLNYVPLRTLAEFVAGSGAWDARAAYLSAMREWWQRINPRGAPIRFEDFILFGDCYYLPHEEGPEAEALYELAKILVRHNPAKPIVPIELLRERMARLRGLCGQLAEILERQLFYALFRRIQDLREELDLLEQYASFVMDNKEPNGAFECNSHLPATYRGGIVARLQKLLVQQADGSFKPAPHLETRPGIENTHRRNRVLSYE